MADVTMGKFSGPAEPGRDVLGVLLDAGAPIAYICMAGSCCTCRVRVISGAQHLAPKTQAETFHLPAGGGSVDERLACQAVCLGTGDVQVDQ
ncbi:MAG: (2Fe-2S)-binding protein [Planctomycetes bacterium]|nr:(2Fe-2S)-binding protein [Planctomycetota bacterium]